MKSIKSLIEAYRKLPAAKALRVRIPRTGARTMNRTVLPDGQAIRKARLSKCWTQEDLVYETHRLVERLAKEEEDARARGRFHHRYQRRWKGKRQFAGISKNTISKMESGGEVFALTILIVSLTLEVPVESLLRDIAA